MLPMPTNRFSTDSFPKLEQDILVSFLIPVYDAEDKLPATLDSIVKQDNGHIEIICVDDGSSDSSGDILSRYEQKYSFFHAIHQENRGAAAARNLAMDHANGMWLCFIDSDDIISNDTVRVIQEKADSSCDIIYFNYQQFTDKPLMTNTGTCDRIFIEGKDILKLQGKRMCSSTLQLSLSAEKQRI